MKKLLFLALSFALSGLAAAREDLQAKLIKQLDSTDVFESQLFHNGLLWTGDSHAEPRNQLLVYNREGALVGQVNLEHTVHNIYPFSANSVLVTGNRYVDIGSSGAMYSYYTIVQSQGASVNVVRSKRWSLDVNTLYYTSFGNNAYFGAPGGSLENPGNDPGVPSILVEQGSSYRFVPARLNMLNYMLATGPTTVYAATGNSMIGDFTIYKVDTATAVKTSVFPTYRDSLFELEPIAPNVVATAERGANQVLLIDTAEGKLIREIKIPEGDPRSIAKFGSSCFVVASQNSKKLTFINFKNEDKIVDTWNLNEFDDTLRMLRKISADFETGTVYVRASYAMGTTSTEIINGVVSVRQPSNAVVEQCR